MKTFTNTPRLSMLLLIISLTLTLFSCDDDNESSAPVISGFTPTSALPGTVVIISGTRFGTSTGDNAVAFAGTPATILSETSTQLEVIVPPLATTGKITVTVHGQHTATSATDFTVLQTGITSFSPTAGQTGTSVTIIGTNFSAIPSENIVKFNGETATVTSATANELVVTVPSAATTGKISVSLGGKVTTSTTDFTVLQTTITGFSPTSGTHGTTVTITGTNFSTTLADNVVLFNGVAATVSAASSTELTVTVPADATTGKISISVDGNSATSATDFTVPTPDITAYAPLIAAPGLSVTITGTNFSPIESNNIVKFNGVAATVTSASSTELTVTVPAGATTGAITVKVGTSTATSSTDFEICSGSAELLISDVVISNNTGATSYYVSFKITNVGSANADLTKVGMQNYASTDNAQGGDVAASGFSFSSGPTLTPGQSYDTPNYSCSIVGGNTTSHPYLIITIYDFPDGEIPECNVDNNIVISPFD